MKSFFNTLIRWFVQRLVKIPERDRGISAWMIFAFALATTISAVIVAIGNPTGANLAARVLDIGKAVLINGLLFVVSTAILGALLSFLYVPLPRLFLGSFIYTAFTSVAILEIASSGTLFSYVIGIGYSLFAIIIGFIFVLLFHKRIYRPVKMTTAVLLIGLLSIGLLFNGETANHHHVIPAMAEHVDPITAENPATFGDYPYTFFTYGSGEDLHREWFGRDVDVRTPTVDASHFVTSWKESRTSFWGFDQRNLPVNGRVWMPEGDGTFPMILMVHGNHTMENFSTSGYDYIGELLASRGIIAISVDEDFVNYSNIYGIPNDDYRLRAWMLLQHLVHLQEMHADPNHPFYRKIDFNNVALMGHSRGGQAAAMAVDAKRFFEDDEQLLADVQHVHIQGVIALAPTDKRIDDQYPYLHNTSYMVIHGARDADVRIFRGDRQYERVSFDKDVEGFKAAVYIADANHTQFNSDWGRHDLSMPRGVFLNQQQTMTPEEQRRMAQVYVSAFLESVFNGQRDYEKLFQDYRYGQDWLPDRLVVSKYSPASYTTIKSYQRRADSQPELTGFDAWEVLRPEHRNGTNRPKDALQLEWTKDASYVIDFQDHDFSSSEALVLTMANANEEAETDQLPKIDIEFVTVDGVSVRMPLEEVMPFPPVIKTDYTHYGLLDGIFRDGRYKQAWEPVFQTFAIPFNMIENEDIRFKRSNLQQITLYFKPIPGKILIEEFGVW